MRRQRQSWREAIQDIENSMKAPEALNHGERDINSSLFRTAVICSDMLKEPKLRDRWMRHWEAEHPDDPEVGRQKRYLREKWGRSR